MHSITVLCLLFAFANVKADLSLGHRHEGPGPNDQYNGETPFGPTGGHQHNLNCYTPNGEINHQEHYEHPHHHVGGADEILGGSVSGGGNQGYGYQQPNFQSYNQQSSQQFQVQQPAIVSSNAQSFESGPSFNGPAPNENQLSERFGSNSFGSATGLSAGFGHPTGPSVIGGGAVLGGGAALGGNFGGGGGHFGDSGNFGDGGSGGGGSLNDEQHQELPPIVTKNFYFHAAPEEPEINLGTKYINLGRSHKAYNVIFIRAPTYSASANIVPVLPKNQQKTIVYLLSKKPEFNTHVEDVKEEAYKPVKPDIFFLKYKTAADAEHAQHQIQAAYDAQSFGVNSDTGIDPQSLRLGIQEDFADNNEGGGIGGGIGGTSTGNGAVSVGINGGGFCGESSEEQEEHHHHPQSNHHHHPTATGQQFSNNDFASSSNQQNDNAVDVNFISTSQNHQHNVGATAGGIGGGSGGGGGAGGCCGGSTGNGGESGQNQPPPCCGK